jgi:hypothetical protein
MENMPLPLYQAGYWGGFSSECHELTLDSVENYHPTQKIIFEEI